MGKGLEARGSKLLDEDRRESFLAETEILQLAATGFASQGPIGATRSYPDFNVNLRPNATNAPLLLSAERLSPNYFCGYCGFPLEPHLGRGARRFREFKAVVSWRVSTLAPITLSPYFSPAPSSPQPQPSFLPWCTP